MSQIWILLGTRHQYVRVVQNVCLFGQTLQQLMAKPKKSTQDSKHNKVSQSPRKIVEESVTENQFSEIQEATKKAPIDKTHVGTKLNTNFFTRVSTTIYMLVGYILLMGMGHFYVGLLVCALIVGIYREVNNITRREEKENHIPMTPALNWLTFGLGFYYILGKLVINKLPLLILRHQWLGGLLLYHNFIIFCGFMGALTLFVLSLKNGFMRYQFKLFAWNCLSLFLILGPGSAILNNTFEGLCWFILPTFMVICNDIFAYLVGYFFGKTRLIELSPKKTWEGYIGGAVITFFFSLVLTSIIGEMPTLVCPQNDLTIVPFSHPSCESFLLESVTVNLGLFQSSHTYLQLYTLGLSLFASLIAPFGGFFASGLKRTIKIKDFADTIPGHGGITDRMDCQLMMGGFAYFYLHSIILQRGNPFSLFLQGLTPLQRLQLFKQLSKSLLVDGLINGSMVIN